MAAQCERQLVGRNARAVVFDDDGTMPPPTSFTLISLAPASSALSTSSRTTEAGRSTTSPAAIWLISSSGSSRIGRRGVGDRTAFIGAL